MSQNAIVKKVVHPGVVEVSLMRQMECGLSCSSCEGCPQRPKEEILALASDPQGGAKPVDWVEVEPASGSAIGFALLVFFLPCVFLLGGYLIGRLLGLGDGGSIGMAAAGLVLGFVPAVLINRTITRRKTPEFTVLGYLHSV